MTAESPTVCVHVVRHGYALCMTVGSPPASWPEGHKWVRAEEAELATCGPCRIAAAVTLETFDAVAALLGAYCWERAPEGLVTLCRGEAVFRTFAREFPVGEEQTEARVTDPAVAGVIAPEHQLEARARMDALRAIEEIVRPFSGEARLRILQSAITLCAKGR